MKDRFYYSLFTFHYSFFSIHCLSFFTLHFSLLFMIGRIVQLNIAPRGGVPKLPVDEAFLTANGLEGDAQAHTEFHGGPERALCLYALERIELLRREGHPIFPGSVGENLTIEGLDWSAIVPGVRLALGDAVEIEITSYTVPCRTIRHSFANGEFKRILQTLHPGDARVYARVIREGRLTKGQSVRVIADARAR
jgi:MOSC domain-containing protein YiiM